jgi:hypothetical protein
MPQSIGGASSGGFRAVRRRGTPAAAWVAVALGAVAAAGLGFYVYDQQRQKKDKEESRQTAVAAEPPVETAPLEAATRQSAGAADDKSKSSSENKQPADAVNAKPRTKKEPAPRSAARKKKPADDKPAERSTKSDGESKDAKSAEPKSPGRVVVRVSSFGSPRDAPADESPAELTTMIEEGLSVLEDGKFDDFVAKYVYPAKPSESEQEPDEDEQEPSGPPTAKPTGKEIAGLAGDRLRLALKHIGTSEAKPHFPLEDLSVAVFVLSDKTQLHFVQVEKQWRLHRHRAVRFRHLTPQERLIGLLARQSGKEAVKPTEEVVGEARMGVISQLERMNAVVAVSAAGEEERTAVLLGPKYSGGLEGMKLFAQLGNLEMLVCESPPGFDDNLLAELDEMTYLRYLKLVGITSPLPITLHLREMTRLETLVIEGGLMEDIHMEHLERLAALRRLVIYGRGLTDAALDRLQSLANLRELTLEIRPDGSFSGEAVARLRSAVPNLWVDW